MLLMPGLCGAHSHVNRRATWRYAKALVFQDPFQTLVCVFFSFFPWWGYFSVQSGRQECCCPRQLDHPPPSTPTPTGPWRSPKGALFKPHSLSYFPREIHTPGQTAQTDHCVHKGELSIATVHLQCHVLFFFFFSPKTPQRELILDSTKTLNCHCSFWSRETSGGALGMGCVFIRSLVACRETAPSAAAVPIRQKIKRHARLLPPPFPMYVLIFELPGPPGWCLCCVGPLDDLDFFALCPLSPGICIRKPAVRFQVRPNMFLFFS